MIRVLVRVFTCATLCLAACDCGATSSRTDEAAGVSQGSARVPPPQGPPHEPLQAIVSDSPSAGHVRSARGDLDGNGFADILVSRTDGPPPIETMDIYRVDAAGVPAVPSYSMAAGTSCGMGSISPLRSSDVNGDGFADVVMPYPAREGELRILLGGASGTFTNGPVIASPAHEVPSCFGQAIAESAAPFEGHRELAVGAPLQHGEAGRVYVFRGSPSGPEATPSMTIEAPDGAGSRFGSSVAMCDLTGDQRDDVIVGAPYVNDRRGRVYVFDGRSGREAARFDVERPGAPDPNNTYFEFGGRLQALSAANGCDVVAIANGVSLHGVYAIRGVSAARGVPTIQAPRLIAGTERLGAVQGIAVGDIDGDAAADLVFAGAGFLQVYRSTPAGLASAPSVNLTSRSEVGRRWATSVSVPGDVDGDGFEDVVAGDGEHAFLLFGSASGVRGALHVISPQLSTEMGRAEWVR